MKTPPPKIPRDIQIRAVRPWTSARTGEAAHLALSPAAKLELGRLAEVIEFRTAGSRILTEGQPAAFVYLLADGIVQADRTINDGERQILAFYWPGDLFGMAERGLYVNSAEAVTPCTVYRFPSDRLERLLRVNTEIQHDFFVKAVHDLRSCQRHVVVLGRLTIARRLAAFLLDCAGHEHYFDRAASMLEMPLTRYAIADYLGTSAESVTRAFGQLEEKALVRRLGPRGIELRIPELAAFADVD